MIRVLWSNASPKEKFNLKFAIVGLIIQLAGIIWGTFIYPFIPLQVWCGFFLLWEIRKIFKIVQAINYRMQK